MVRIPREIHQQNVEVYFILIFKIRSKLKEKEENSRYEIT